MRGSKTILKGAALLSAVLMSACATVGTQTTTATADDASIAGLIKKVSLEDYQLGPGDSIRIIVYQEPDLSGTFAINTNGEVSLPLVGQVSAAGLTTKELASNVESQLSRGYVKDASVAAEVVTYRPYYIYGEVAKAGEYPYAANINVAKAVAAAGGFTYRAKKSFVYILRAGASQEVRVNVSHDVFIYPGDTVRVVERFF